MKLRDIATKGAKIAAFSLKGRGKDRMGHKNDRARIGGNT